MHEYDVTLKLILRNLAAIAARTLTGVTITRWHNVELPEIRNSRMDLLGESEAGRLIQIELQSHNEANLPVRMLEYRVQGYRTSGAFPRQIVLYVGEAPMRMESTLTIDRLSFSFELLDIRDLDGEALLASPEVSDNVFAVLTRLRDQYGAVRQILSRIATLNGAERELAFRQLMILAGLRRLANYVREEANRMPILTDIMEHDVIGPAIRQGLEQGRREGRQEGLDEGRRGEAESMLCRLIAKRFGGVPESFTIQIAAHSADELEDLMLRVLDAKSIEDLLR